MESNFSVLMSLYIKEQADYFAECMDSVLSNTVLPNEIVIVLDGPITDELKSVLEAYIQSNPNLYVIVPLKTNQGLGVALREGVLRCSNELIARMDTDDICRPDRFEHQLKEFEQNPNLDICGSHVAEFEESPDVIIAQRLVPLDHEGIKKYQRRRDAFNHMSVMFKKTSVLRAGNYQSCPLMEDTLLWVNMLRTGSIGKNINDFLVYVRIGNDMYERRGGIEYFKKYLRGRKKVYETGFISWLDYKSTLVVQLIVALMPNAIRGHIFKRVLHKNKHRTKEI